MKHLFICSTPLQLMTAINIRVEHLGNEYCALYILDHSYNSKELYENILKENIFNKVYFLKTKKFNNHWMQNNPLILILEYFIYKIFNKIFVKDATIYDQFWISSMHRSSWLIFLNYKKRNQKLILSFF